jgi:uncharacterized protein (DUF433 family)
MATVEVGPVRVSEMIVATPGYVGGRPRLAGTRMPVHALAAYHVQEGLTAEQIQREVFSHLSLTQVYAALAYFYANRAEIEAIWQEDEQFEREFLERYPERYWGPQNDRGLPR